MTFDLRAIELPYHGVTNDGRRVYVCTRRDKPLELPGCSFLSTDDKAGSHELDWFGWVLQGTTWYRSRWRANGTGVNGTRNIVGPWFKPIDLSKTELPAYFEMRNGRMALIDGIKPQSPQGLRPGRPAFGWYKSSDNFWKASSWDLDGSNPVDDRFDLITQAPPPVPAAAEHHTVYINFYAYGKPVSAVIHSSRKAADRDCTDDRVACKKVTFTEGDFDD